MFILPPHYSDNSGTVREATNSVWTTVGEFQSKGLKKKKSQVTPLVCRSVQNAESDCTIIQSLM